MNAEQEVQHTYNTVKTCAEQNGITELQAAVALMLLGGKKLARVIDVIMGDADDGFDDNGVDAAVRKLVG